MAQAAHQAAGRDVHPAHESACAGDSGRRGADPRQAGARAGCLARRSITAPLPACQAATDPWTRGWRFGGRSRVTRKYPLWKGCYPMLFEPGRRHVREEIKARLTRSTTRCARHTAWGVSKERMESKKPRARNSHRWSSTSLRDFSHEYCGRRIGNPDPTFSDFCSMFELANRSGYRGAAATLGTNLHHRTRWPRPARRRRRA